MRSGRLRYLRLILVITMAASVTLVLICPALLRAANSSAPPSLKGIPVPESPLIEKYVKDRERAIELGKALFWDMQVGSDGVQACGSCHFNAGVDNRIKNQLSPGGANSNTGPGVGFELGGPNYTLKLTGFPILNKAIDDVISSQGVFRFNFVDIVPGSAVDAGQYLPDPIFQVGGVNVRRVEPRHTPSMFNAAFNLRNFWDARAHQMFNGGTPFGPGTGDRIFTARNNKVQEIAVNIHFSSLASQSVGPPPNTFEMSYANRPFAKIGKKMLSLKPLAKQRVHAEDSVLGDLAETTGPGLQTTYADMIEAAFVDELWDSDKILLYNVKKNRVVVQENPNRPLTTDEFTVMEANFAFFMGIAIQLYEATLITDETPFDKFQENAGILTAQEEEGLDLFMTKGLCISCHGGPLFSNATTPVLLPNHRISRMTMGDGGVAVYDVGFYNIGKRLTASDLGVGGTDSKGRPLSFARQAQLGDSVRFDVDPPVSPTERVAVDGAFKVPSLRNVELTGPFFHDGSSATLEQVVNFYNFGGLFAQENIANLDPNIRLLNLTVDERAAIVAFLKTLTDPRVRTQQAPFDHPEIFVPNGHPTDELSVVNDGTGKAVDALLRIPEVGRNGGPPLQPFHLQLGP